MKEAVKIALVIVASAALILWGVSGVQAGSQDTDPPIQAAYGLMALTAGIAPFLALQERWRLTILALVIAVLLVPILLAAQISCCLE